MSAVLETEVLGLVYAQPAMPANLSHSLCLPACIMDTFMYSSLSRPIGPPRQPSYSIRLSHLGRCRGLRRRHGRVAMMLHLTPDNIILPDPASASLAVAHALLVSHLPSCAVQPSIQLCDIFLLRNQPFRPSLYS
jgi:hypothetical protein